MSLPFRSFQTIVNREDNSRSQTLLPEWKYLLHFQMVSDRVSWLGRASSPVCSPVSPLKESCMPTSQKGRTKGAHTFLIKDS